MNVAINTGGGDAPGLNAAIRAATLAGLKRGWNMYGIKNGYSSLFTDEPFVELDEEKVRGITLQGGTILGTVNHGNPFAMPYTDDDGTEKHRDLSDRVMEVFDEHNIDALIAIGGDGSMHIAGKLIKKGLNVVGIPKTIDNDIYGCEVSLGFDTAVTTATEAIDKLTTTAESHHRLMPVEVMGRNAGWIALHSGLSAAADVILIPEVPFRYEPIVKKIEKREQKGRTYTIIVVAEGAKEKGGKPITTQKGDKDKLGGIANLVGRELSERTDKESRSLVLGHIQRGGTPTTFDRLISLRFGAAAVRCVESGDFNKLVVPSGENSLTNIPITDVAGKNKQIPLDSDILQTARDIGICMGD